MSTNQLRNPATGEPVAELSDHSVEEFQAMVCAARDAQPGWAGLGVRERGRIILRMRRLISERQHEIASLVSTCTGKTRSDALSGEAAPVGMAAGWYPRVARRIMGRHPVRPRQPFFALIKKPYLIREPLGVVGIISPWNYPFGIPMHEIMMALITGNTVILKVATQVQPIGELTIDLVRSAGVPEKAIQLVHLRGSVAGKAFLEAAIDKLHFTRSTAVGKELAAGAGARLLPLGLELGGNDAMIVLGDANVERAVNAAIWAGLSNAGQSCGGVERIVIEDGIYDQFRDRLAAKVANLRIGPDDGHNVDVGSLTTNSQSDLVRAHLQDALKKGATIVAQADPLQTPNGNSSSKEPAEIFHGAVVLENVDRLMDVVQHGMAETPWGGYKESSMGRTHGWAGLEAMTRQKVVVESRFKRSPHQIWWMPNGTRPYAVVSSILPVLYGPGRLRAIRKLVPSFVESLFRTPKVD